MATTYKELLAAAHAAVPKVTPAEAAGWSRRPAP